MMMMKGMDIGQHLDLYPENVILLLKNVQMKR